MPGTIEGEAMSNKFCPEHGSQLEQTEDGKYICIICGYTEEANE